MRMPHSSVIPDYSGGFSELREVTDNIMDPSNPVDVGLMGLGMAPIPGARVPIGLRALSKAAQYILQNGLGKARRLFPKSAIDDAVVELGKRESQIITKANEANKGRKAGYMEDAQAARRNQGRTTRRGMRDKDPDYYLDDYPVEKPLGFAAGGMPRSPLMLPTPVPSQRPPRTYIHEMGPRFEGDNPRFNIPAPSMSRGPIGSSGFPDGYNPNKRLYAGGTDLIDYANDPVFHRVRNMHRSMPEITQGFLDSRGLSDEPSFTDVLPPSIEQRRPPMQYIGEGAPRMGMPPEMPQFPGRQPKFPGMMQPIRDPEPVGPPPGMPPVDNQTRTTEQLIRVPLSESELINQIRGDLPPPIKEYINEGAPRPITEEELLQIDPDYFKQPGEDRFKQPGDDRGFIPMPLDYGMNNTPAPDPIGIGNTLMPPEVLNPDGTPTWVDPIETAPDGGPPGGPPIEPMPPEVFPDEPEQTAQPTQDQFMERLMQLIQALQERSQPVAQPAPQPVQQMPPPPPRPPATPFNMGNSGMSGGAPTMPQMFNSGPGFFTPQQRGPRIAPGAIAQQGQEMPNYNLDFSSFLRNR